jgi:hypothetical protein
MAKPHAGAGGELSVDHHIALCVHPRPPSLESPLRGAIALPKGTPAELIAAQSTLTGEHLAAYVGT